MIFFSGGNYLKKLVIHKSNPLNEDENDDYLLSFCWSLLHLLIITILPALFFGKKFNTASSSYFTSTLISSSFSCFLLLILKSFMCKSWHIYCITTKFLLCGSQWIIIIIIMLLYVHSASQSVSQSVSHSLACKCVRAYVLKYSPSAWRSWSWSL